MPDKKVCFEKQIQSKQKLSLMAKFYRFVQKHVPKKYNLERSDTDGWQRLS